MFLSKAWRAERAAKQISAIGTWQLLEAELDHGIVRLYAERGGIRRHINLYAAHPAFKTFKNVQAGIEIQFRSLAGPCSDCPEEEVGSYLIPQLVPRHPFKGCKCSMG